MSREGMEDSSSVLQPLRKDFEKVAKRQKVQGKKNTTYLDALLKDLEISKQAILSDPASAKKTLGELSKKVKETKGNFASDQKECYSSISKFGKNLDKTFKLDLGKSNEQVFEDKKPILNHVIANHLYRQGQFSLGETFVKEAKVDMDESLKHQFLEMFQIFESIKQHNLLPALEWAERNREGLSKNGSSLEFRLHHLHFVTLLLNNQKEAALAYAKQTFGRFANTHIKEIQRLMGCFLFLSDLPNSVYADLISKHHWNDVISLFTRDCCSLMGLSYESPLYVGVTVGSVALPTILKVTKMMQSKKTEWSQQDELPVEIPLQKENRYHSIFVCPVAKEQVTEDNPAMLLPCGHAICNESLNKIVKGNGRFKCPYCPTDSTKAAVRKVLF